VIVPSIRLYEQNTQNPTILISTYEINDRTRRTVRQRAGATGVQKWPNRQEYVEESMRADAEADMSFDEKTALHKELAKRN